MPNRTNLGGVLRTTAGCGNSVTVTPVCDTSAYASGDLIVDTTAITDAVDRAGGSAILDSITILDEDAQGVAFTIAMLQASTSCGTRNSAPNITDANLRSNIAGLIPVATNDYVTFSGAKLGCVRNIGLNLKAASNTRTLYFAILNGAGTPTFTASGLKITFNFRVF